MDKIEKIKEFKKIHELKSNCSIKDARIIELEALKYINKELILRKLYEKEENEYYLDNCTHFTIWKNDENNYDIYVFWKFWIQIL